MDLAVRRLQPVKETFIHSLLHSFQRNSLNKYLGRMYGQFPGSLWSCAAEATSECTAEIYPGKRPLKMDTTGLPRQGTAAPPQEDDGGADGARGGDTDTGREERPRLLLRSLVSETPHHLLRTGKNSSTVEASWILEAPILAKHGDYHREPITGARCWTNRPDTRGPEPTRPLQVPRGPPAPPSYSLCSWLWNVCFPPHFIP